MKNLIIKIGNETHDLPYNGEAVKIEVSDKYVPKFGDMVWYLNEFFQPTWFIFVENKPFQKRILKNGLLFPTEENCKEFLEHCLQFQKK